MPWGNRLRGLSRSSCCNQPSGEVPRNCSTIATSPDAWQQCRRIGAFNSRLNADVRCNNAGVQVEKPLLDLEESEWDFVLNTNLKGYFLCLQRAARHMKEKRAGAIVNIGSGCNKLPFPNLSSYSVSKAGIDMLTKAAAVELGPFGIRVNCIGPGAIDTERTRRETSDFAGKWAKLTPLRRIGTPEDVAGAVEFLPLAQSVEQRALGVRFVGDFLDLGHEFGEKVVPLRGAKIQIDSIRRKYLA